MKRGRRFLAQFALATALALACSEGSQEGDTASGGSSGSGGNSKGGSSSSSGSSNRGGDAGAGASGNDGGGQGDAGESNGTSSAGQGGAPSSAGSSSAGDAGAPGQGSGGASSNPCGGCDSGQTCIFQAGGPGPSRFLCAEEPPCAAPAACACIMGQGTCAFVPEEPGTEPSGICVCDNGLD